MAEEEETISTVTLEDVKTRLEEILATLKPGERVMISQDDRPVGFLTRAEQTSWPCKAGSARETDHWMAPDFDAPLDDFREYIE